MKDDPKSDPLGDLVKGMKSAVSPFRRTLREIHREVRAETGGALADYIPELTKVDPDAFGIAVVTADGQVFETGDSKTPFTIQSVSKPFIYGMAVETRGRDYVLDHVGVEPSGEAFNSIVLDEESNRPFNPMVNAGAIATADMIEGDALSERLNSIVGMFERYIGHKLNVDSSVLLSDRASGHRNRAMAHLMLNFGMVGEKVEETLELYLQQCSIRVTALDLATMGATPANGGVNPITGERAIEQQYVKDVLCVMYTCGMYDFAGEWAHRVGLPAKSGVGGGIVAVAPDSLGIGVYSPRLDAKGTSVRGLKVCQALSRELSLHVFESPFNRTALDELLHRSPRTQARRRKAG